MKTITMIITAIFTLQAGILFADNDGSPLNKINETSVTIVNELVPLTPAEATFEDFVSVVDFSALSPVTPSEAWFEDVSDEMVTNLSLAPKSPVTADFE